MISVPPHPLVPPEVEWADPQADAIWLHYPSPEGVNIYWWKLVTDSVYDIGIDSVLDSTWARDRTGMLIITHPLSRIKAGRFNSWICLKYKKLCNRLLLCGRRYRGRYQAGLRTTVVRLIQLPGLLSIALGMLVCRFIRKLGRLMLSYSGGWSEIERRSSLQILIVWYSNYNQSCTCVPHRSSREEVSIIWTQSSGRASR